MFAIDYTNDPYYGETSGENETYIVRSKRKKSTNDFYSYVTLYVTTRDRQMTLAVYPVRQWISKVGYIARCLDRIAELGLHIEALCLDREFYTRKVFGFLTRLQVPFIVPVRKHGKWMKELLKGTQSRYAGYRMKAKPTLLLTIAVAVKYAKGRRGKHGVESLGYVVSGLAWNPRQVHQTYRSRFSIESSYRMRNHGETPDEHEESGYPVPLCHYLLSPQERLDRSGVDVFLSGEARATNHRNARFSIRLVHCCNLGCCLGIDGDGERNCHTKTPGLEKG